MEHRIESFLEEKGLALAGRVSKGYSSEIFLVRSRRGEEFALKAEKEKSPRIEMVRRESENLRIANSLGIGPKLAGFDFEKKVILMEFIDGPTFGNWLFNAKPTKKELEKFLKELFAQAGALDKGGLDHGQLAGKGKNILVRKGRPVIIDFEKASAKRKPHNVRQLEGLIYRNPHSAITKKVAEILGL